MGNPDILLTVDFKIDLYKMNPDTKRYRNFLRSNIMDQLIDEPTRITNTSRSITDHMVTNNADFYNCHGCIDPGLSDHMLIYTTRK